MAQLNVPPQDDGKSTQQSAHQTVGNTTFVSDARHNPNKFGFCARLAKRSSCFPLSLCLHTPNFLMIACRMQHETAGMPAVADTVGSMCLPIGSGRRILLPRIKTTRCGIDTYYHYPRPTVYLRIPGKSSCGGVCSRRYCAPWLCIPYSPFLL